MIYFDIVSIIRSYCVAIIGIKTIIRITRKLLLHHTFRQKLFTSIQCEIERSVIYSKA